ncbi:protein-L-isoaspartate O-methyltransferase [Altererythrobacter sediminis]|uniref:Protein-L-isoaspartate O-methyltransferase n=2 Tax=Allopontixanthobacter sediminis TaxID=1689985 RepID=A0A845AY99_9SPHN|nr:protein-L-isoaspartate O-methyltransferase [Allopontixanthobacter sediminis]
MIDSQLRTSGVNEPFVLARMAAVPREDFVPAAARDTAYIDRAIPLENGRRLAAPLFYGMMLAEAQPLAAETALVVDSGSGYLPELLRPLVKSVDVITPEEALVKSRKAAVYSLMLVDGAVEELPDSLTKRLGDGGRVLTGLVTKGVTRLAVGRKTAGGVALLPLAELGIPRLSEFDKAAGWSF